ncbi:SDR family NAD(P)-dependent oxidoreductase [Paracidovorax valerianellae]|uniref:NAD(P)-dependent dehydrogenase, short-chain alcohol dehydrogenase family n=1 Tax=Paracidovorax valerianellae TaxID=187868 RepID=A0A1G7D729_9BURK|nr:SDR family oxidoreductase [Paracidovorax valerianellae]MDA8447212.1 SDR family oxidoreductase [Paracidovorax valerianellae]SDE47331.1 NAD(P)-dependent dehydrogenase, short-chain alcohol dehydrogenase family [Paracidovorax valerianellae]
MNTVVTTDAAFAAARRIFGLEGKTVLVTGASKGIGQEVARQCAAAGAQVVIAGRDAARLQETLDSLEGSGHRVLAAELTDVAARKQFASDCGPLDGVVHSAGIRGLAPMKMVGDAFLAQVMETNYVAPMMLTRHLLAKGQIRPGGSLVFLSSIAALTGTVGVGPYAGSKAALVGTLRPLALELAKRGIRANALCPGLVETTLITEDKDWFEESRKRYPLGIGLPADVAHACLYFLSGASTKVTGAVFSMDGGVEFV